MTDHEMLETMYVLRWWGLGVTLGNLFLLVVLVASKWLQYRWERVQAADYMTEIRGLLSAARLAAESARSNQMDATNAKADVAARMDTNVARLERTIPEATADKVAERIKDGDGGMTPTNGGHI